MQEVISKVLNVEANQIVNLPLRNERVLASGAVYHHLGANMPAISDKAYQALAIELGLEAVNIFDNYDYFIDRGVIEAAKLDYGDLPLKAFFTIYNEAIKFGATIDRLLLTIDKIVEGAAKIDIENTYLPARDIRIHNTKVIALDYGIEGSNKSDWVLAAKSTIEFCLSIDGVATTFSLNANMGKVSNYSLSCKADDGAADFLLANALGTHSFTAEEVSSFIEAYAALTGITFTETEVVGYFDLLEAAASSIINRYIETNIQFMLFQVEGLDGYSTIKSFDNMDYIELIWFVAPMNNTKFIEYNPYSNNTYESEAIVALALGACRVSGIELRYEEAALESSYNDLVVRSGQLNDIHKEQPDDDWALKAAVTCYHEKRGAGTALLYVKNALLALTEKQKCYNNNMIRILESRKMPQSTFTGSQQPQGEHNDDI